MVVPAWWCMDVCVILGVCMCMCVCVVFVFCVFLSVMLVMFVLLHFMRNKLNKVRGQKVTGSQFVHLSVHTT